jgi:hypothetical protein
MPATHIDSIRTEVIFSHTPPNTTAALIVPNDTHDTLENEMRPLLGHGLDHGFTVAHPMTEEQTVAFMPLPPGRVHMLQQRGIRHAERFLAIFEVIEKSYRRQPRREMWLIDGQHLPEMVT